jgi:hypothetical protein
MVLRKNNALLCILQCLATPSHPGVSAPLWIETLQIPRIPRNGNENTYLFSLYGILKFVLLKARPCQRMPMRGFENGNGLADFEFSRGSKPSDISRL